MATGSHGIISIVDLATRVEKDIFCITSTNERFSYDIAPDVMSLQVYPSQDGPRREEARYLFVTLADGSLYILLMEKQMLWTPEPGG